MNGEEHSFPLPTNNPEMNFTNTRGLRFEADEARQILLDGRIESTIMPNRDSITIAKIQDQLRQQLGVRFDADDYEY